ncbi:MAG: outer membrane protein assembly factor BamA [Rhodospirillales bacterium]|nr:outer membrane protein assembly factor BamA [Rhodospirillales bacterium]
MRSLKNIIYILLGVFLFAASTDSHAQTGGVVRDVIVEGVQRIDPDTVRSYMIIQPGDTFTRERLDRSLKSLFATGLFADVSINRQDGNLIVNVVENPIINQIAFEGNQKIDDELLESETTLKPRVIYTRTKVQNDVKRILTLYRQSGRFAATVEPKVIQLKENRVDLVFEINEGAVTEINSIRFIGNRDFSDGKLKDVIQTKETRWFRLFSSDDKYDPDRITFDREVLRRFYINEGYADFRVISAVAELTPNKENFFLTYTIEEGNRYKVGKVDYVVGLKDLTEENLKAVVEIEPGDWYSAEDVDDTIQDLTNVVGNKGYAFVDVRPRTIRDRKNNKVDIVFEVGEGPRVFVERIEIKGNSRTEDEVVRREFKLVEGDAFNSARLRRSKQRIEGLGFFEKVSVQQVPGSAPDKTVVSVEVAEKSTGSLSLGAGYSTQNGALVDIGISEKNLLGKGQEINLSATIASKQSQLDFSFTEPYFLDREISAGFDLFNTKSDLQDSSSYDSEETGTNLRIGYPVTEELRQGWSYTLKQSTIENVDTDASVYVLSQAGTTLLSMVSHSLFYDKRDNATKPTEGYVASLNNDLAGLGGDDKFFRNSMSAKYYYSVVDDLILSLSGSLGHIAGIGQDVKLSNRFFIGGDNLRGFANSGVGPRDISTDDSLGGEWRYLSSAQLSFPLGLPGEYDITGHVFADIGSSGKLAQSGANISDTQSLRASLGTGVAWVSPFGPIGIDIATPVMKEEFDKIERVRVNFGTRF